MKKVCLILVCFISIHLFGQSNTTPAKIKAATGINAIVEDNSWFSFKVLSYNVFYQPKGDDPVTIANNGATFSPQVKKLIQMAKPGDVYYIEDIKVMGPDNLVRKIPGITFKII